MNLRTARSHSRQFLSCSMLFSFVCRLWRLSCKTCTRCKSKQIRTTLQYSGTQPSSFWWQESLTLAVLVSFTDHMRSVQLSRHASVVLVNVSAVYAVIVCLSVHLSYASIVLKWLNIVSCKQCRTISPETLVFWCQRSQRNFNRITPTEASNRRMGHGQVTRTIKFW